MFARVVEIKTKPGKAKEVCQMLHEKILKTLKAQSGFVDELVLTDDMHGIVAISLWKTREDAEHYKREHYLEVHDLIKHLVHAEPKVHAYDVETSTAHKYGHGKAA